MRAWGIEVPGALGRPVALGTVSIFSCKATWAIAGCTAPHFEFEKAIGRDIRNLTFAQVEGPFRGILFALNIRLRPKREENNLFSALSSPPQ